MLGTVWGLERNVLGFSTISILMDLVEEESAFSNEKEKQKQRKVGRHHSMI